MDTLLLKKLEGRVRRRKFMEKLKSVKTSKFIASWRQSKK